MSMPRLDIVILGLSITSSWGNGHATTYRGLVQALVARGHSVLFLERDVPWYAAARDLPTPPYGCTELYTSLDDLQDRFSTAIQRADVVVVGSYVPDGLVIGTWVTQTARGVTAFYDIDTPVTLTKLRSGDYEYLSPALVPRYHLYLSFTGGPILTQLEHVYGVAMARPLYCSVDPLGYAPEARDWTYDLGYMGTYSADRQAALQCLLLEPAQHWPQGRFVVVGPEFPAAIHWPANLARIDHLPPPAHRSFYNAQRFTLNLTRAPMCQVGYAPSVRLFEAAACATPIISDAWPGLETFSCLAQRFSLVGHQTRRCVTCTISQQKNAMRWVHGPARASWQSIQPSIGQPPLRGMCWRPVGRTREGYAASTNCRA